MWTLGGAAALHRVGLNGFKREDDGPVSLSSASQKVKHGVGLVFPKKSFI